MDSREDTEKVAADLGYPVAYGVTRETADRIGAWWVDSGNHLQPSEFIIKQDGSLLASVYSSAPVGRLEPEATLELIKFLNSKK